MRRVACPHIPVWVCQVISYFPWFTFMKIKVLTKSAFLNCAKKNYYLFWGLFLCLRSLAKSKKSPGRRCRTLWIDWHLFHQYFWRVQNRPFSSVSGVGVGVGGGGSWGRGERLKKWPNFELGIFYSFKSLGTSTCRKNYLGIIFKFKQSLNKYFWFWSNTR